MRLSWEIPSNFCLLAYLLTLLLLAPTVSHNGFEYEAPNGARVPWPQAEQHCMDSGGHLASITSEEENTLLTTFATAQYSCGSRYDVPLMKVSLSRSICYVFHVYENH